MRRVLTVAVLAVSLAVPAVASAQAAPLSKRYADDIASSYATREAHRIWLLRDIGVETEPSMCRRRSPTLVNCAMKVSLYWDGPATSPTEVEGTLAVHLIGIDRLTTRLVKQWEVLPPPKEVEESLAEQLARGERECSKSPQCVKESEEPAS